MSRATLAGALLLLAACGDASTQEEDIATGARLAADPALSPAAANFVACTTCHATGLDGPTDQIYPGSPLAGAASRASFWGGQELELLAAVNACRNYFMYVPQPWTADDPNARAIGMYLADLDRRAPAELRTPQRHTFVAQITDVPRGDAARGAALYNRACRSCHGASSTGQGRPSTRPVILPEESVREHTYLLRSGGLQAVRLVFIEKIRHGGFYGYEGSMPPFSREVLSDAELGDILSYFELDP